MIRNESVTNCQELLMILYFPKIKKDGIIGAILFYLTIFLQ